MGYVTLSELRARPGTVWAWIDAGEEIVFTRRGKPFALLLPIKAEEVDTALRACRAARMGVVLDRLHAQVQAQGADGITDAEIEAEIKAVRARCQAAGAPTAAEVEPRRR